MKKTVALIGAAAFSAVLSILSSCTIQQASQSPRTVTVYASGEVEVENEKAVISFAVITRNNDIVKATSENATKMDSVMKALVESGIGKNYITTSNYSIYQESNYQNGRNVLGQYVVSNQINVAITDTEKTGSTIDVAVKAGANQLNSLYFKAGSTAAAEKQARILAVREAEQKANTLATTSGSTLGKVLTITETSGSAVRESNDMVLMRAAKAEVSTPVQAGKTIVTVRIEATYELQ